MLEWVIRCDDEHFSRCARVRLELWRDGRTQTVTVELGELAGAVSESGSDAGPPKLGLRLEDPTPEVRRRLGVDDARGPIVTAVDPGSPAAEAGIRPGDVLTMYIYKPELDQRTLETVKIDDP